MSFPHSPLRRAESLTTLLDHKESLFENAMAMLGDLMTVGALTMPVQKDTSLQFPLTRSPQERQIQGLSSREKVRLKYVMEALNAARNREDSFAPVIELGGDEADAEVAEWLKQDFMATPRHSKVTPRPPALASYRAILCLRGVHEERGLC